MNGFASSGVGHRKPYHVSGGRRASSIQVGGMHLITSDWLSSKYDSIRSSQ